MIIETFSPVKNYEYRGVVMQKYRMEHDHGKSRVAQMNMADICNGTVIGGFVLWSVWVATSLLLHFMQ